MEAPDTEVAATVVPISVSTRVTLALGAIGLGSGDPTGPDPPEVSGVRFKGLREWAVVLGSGRPGESMSIPEVPGASTRARYVDVEDLDAPSGRRGRREHRS